MTDTEVQRKLNQLTKIANELSVEAIRRYGPEGILFFEADGAFFLMSKDTGDVQRQDNVTFQSIGHCRMDCGAW